MQNKKRKLKKKTEGKTGMHKKNERERGRQKQ
jgi:hypothetical protein